MYAKFFKRLIDIVLSLMGLVLFSPIFVILIIAGAIAMRGNPFFTQMRPGRIDKNTDKEKIFKLVKFRTMSNQKDKDGKLLPDNIRLNKYGRILRSTSLDELPELWNILTGHMSIVGPRPLAVQYLPYYNDEERRRHSIRPGLTGWAQVNGRTAISWEQRFRYDIEYVDGISFAFDCKILFQTFMKVVKRSDIVEAGSQGDFDKYRKKQWEDAGNGCK